jgi:hypothetical protein
LLVCAAAGCFAPGDDTPFGRPGDSSNATDGSTGAVDATTSEESASSGSGDETDAGSSDDSGACLLANPPGLLMLEGQAFPRTAPMAQWSPPAPGCAETTDYELAVGTLASGDDVMPFTSFGATAQWDGAVVSGHRLPDGVDLFLSVRAVDDAGNVSTALSSFPFQIWSPAQLDGLALWIDYADAKVVFSDADCTVAATEGDALACVLDKSGNANHVRSPEGGVGPELEPRTRHDVATARFVGDRVLEAEDSATLSPGLPALTMAIVDAPMSVNSTVDGGARYAIQKEDAFQLAYYDDNVHVAIDTITPGVWGWGASPLPTQAVGQLNIFEHDDTTWRFRRDGVALGESSPGNGQVGALAVSNAPLRLGVRIDGLNTSWGYDAAQAEVIILTTVLEPEAMANLERYLQEKWRDLIQAAARR